MEALLAAYDADPLDALTIALRVVLDAPDASWVELVGRAPLTDTRRAALLLGEDGALDDLARELNEVRTLDT